jgi:diguanylate cyclase (GGDEF)-like protein/PAS domain S-box-containing protein
MMDGARQGGKGAGDGPLAIDDPYRLLVENITDYAIYMLDPNGVVTNWNRGAQRFKGYAAGEIVGQHFSRFFTEQDRAAALPDRILATAEREDRFEGQGWRVRKDGTRFWAHVVVDTIRNDEGDVLGFAKITRDISEHRKAEERLYRLAHYDPLTALPNRITLRETLDKAIQSGSGATVLMIDLDGFKEVNDTQGHAAGDVVLKAAGDRLKERIGARGTVGRLGGDEFAVVLPNLSDPLEAANICDDLIASFRAPFSSEGQDAFLGLSLGIAMSPSHGDCATDLLASADFALYRAKSEPGVGYCVFQPSFRQAALARRNCDQELREAVAQGQLEMHYQPLVRLEDYRVTGAEALLRWRHPQHGLIAPDAFLDVLERGRLARAVGDWTIHEAATLARRFRANGLPSFRANVNLFAVQLRQDELAETVTKALEATGLPPDALELEITENIFLQEGEAMIGPLRQLRDLGVGIAFDDYGTGFASLSLLKRFPLTRLKIDRSFVRNLCTDKEDEAVVRAIAYLAEGFGLEVTAEGVERDDQHQRLRELGCESAQGYLFGRPMTGPRIMEIMNGAQHDGLARWPHFPPKLAGVADETFVKRA